MSNSRVDQLKILIEHSVYIKNQDRQIGVSDNPLDWTFDFQQIFLNGKYSQLLTDVFYEHLKPRYPFQLGTLESGGIPLLSALIAKFYNDEAQNVSGFFIRKSRQKHGLMNLIEGQIQPHTDIILIDDIINSGESFWRQINILKEVGYAVKAIYTILQFRDDTYYESFHKENIALHSLFQLDDFTETLGEHVHNLSSSKPYLKQPFTSHWRFKSDNPSYAHIAPKSQPLLLDDKIFVGSDNRTFWALHQSDGRVAWSYQVGPARAKKSITSNPVQYSDMVIFGAYDGQVYALDIKTGKKCWSFYEGDYVGSSPVVAPDLGLIFIGLEFGLFKKYGGIVALDGKTGRKVWGDYSLPAFVHSTPFYIAEYQEVVIGANDGRVRLFDARTGKLKWCFTTKGGASYQPQHGLGFSEGDIKESFAYDNKHDLLIFGSMDCRLYILKRATGELVHAEAAEFGIWATPFLANNVVYYTSLDKNVRALDLSTFQIVYKKNLDDTRLFSSPTIINNHLFVGTNGGRLFQMDPESGEMKAFFQVTERITNTVVYNPVTRRFFLPTFANEIYALESQEPIIKE